MGTGTYPGACLSGLRGPQLNAPTLQGPKGPWSTSAINETVTSEEDLLYYGILCPPNTA